MSKARGTDAGSRASPDYEYPTTMAFHQLEVERCGVDFGDIAWSTLGRLAYGASHLGSDEDFIEAFKYIVKPPNNLGTRFENPMYSIRANLPTRDFIRKARSAQQGWLRTLRQALGWSSSHLKANIKKETPILRQLKFTGVMIVDGRHVSPDQWPTGITEYTLVGQRFGCLEVVSPGECGMWICRCECGQVHTMSRKHLEASRDLSCSCRNRELTPSVEKKLERRPWRWT